MCAESGPKCINDDEANHVSCCCLINPVAQMTTSNAHLQPTTSPPPAPATAPAPASRSGPRDICAESYQGSDAHVTSVKSQLSSGGHGDIFNDHEHELKQKYGNFYGLQYYNVNDGSWFTHCFSRATTACRVHDATATPAAAFAACFFPEGDTTTASRVAMVELVAGDIVLSADAAHDPVLARVIVNQHAQSSSQSPMLTIEHTNGTLELTPDHVLLVDGEFVAARYAKQGSILEPSARITSIGTGAAGFINPLTSNGRILAAGVTGLPVVSSTYPEWIAHWMLSTTLYPLPISLSNLLSYLFPASVQAFYDSYLEPFLTWATPALMAYKGAMPELLVVLAFPLIDCAIALAFVAYSALSALAFAAQLSAQRRGLRGRHRLGGRA
jgi:hypothetical protein